MRARKSRGQAGYGAPSRLTWSTSIAADRGAYGSTVNVDGSGTRRISPTGPIPSTGWNWSSEFIACIAFVSPTPVAIRSARCSTGTTLPRTTPPLSQYRKRTSRTSASRHDATSSSAVGTVIVPKCGSLCRHRHTTGVSAPTVRAIAASAHSPSPLDPDKGEPDVPPFHRSAPAAPAARVARLVRDPADVDRVRCRERLGSVRRRPTAGTGRPEH